MISHLVVCNARTKCIFIPFFLSLSRYSRFPGKKKISFFLKEIECLSPAVCAQGYNDCHIYVQFSSSNHPLSGTRNWPISGRRWVNRFRIVRENQSFESTSAATMCRRTHKPMTVNYGHLLSPIIIISSARNKFSSNAEAHSCWRRFPFHIQLETESKMNFRQFQCGIEWFPVKKRMRKRGKKNTDSVRTIDLHLVRCYTANTVAAESRMEVAGVIDTKAPKRK